MLRPLEVWIATLALAMAKVAATWSIAVNYKQAELGVAMTSHGWRDRVPDTPCQKSSQGPGAINANKLGTGHVNVLRGEDHMHLVAKPRCHLPLPA